MAGFALRVFAVLTAFFEAFFDVLRAMALTPADKIIAASRTW
jgi:hypothetical protein